MFLEKKKGIQALALEDCVDVSIQGLKDNNMKCKERLVTAANNNSGKISTDRRTSITGKQKWKERQLYIYFKQETGDIMR